MGSESVSFMLENGLNLSDVVTTGSTLHINQDYDDPELNLEQNNAAQAQNIDVLGQPVPSFAELAENLVAIDEAKYVKKKIIEQGGGQPLHEGCTVSFAFSGYWENEKEPFDSVPLKKPMKVDLKENGLLPGLQMAIKSMLVGEKSVFLFSYKVMYGEIGVPPRIKPKADCVFYIKLIRSTLTSENTKIDDYEPRIFDIAVLGVKRYYSSGCALYEMRNYKAAIKTFESAVSMISLVRLANEEEEKIQEKLLKKLYINLVICCNQVKMPLLACTYCNELNGLKSLWNNAKVLFQNAKALRMIGNYDEAEKKLKRAMKLDPGQADMEAEYKLLMEARKATEKAKQKAEIVKQAIISDEFKREVDDLVKKFKLNDEEVQLLIPSHFNSEEIAYFKEVCVKENLFFSKHHKSVIRDKEVSQTGEEQAEVPVDDALQKNKNE